MPLPLIAGALGLAVEAVPSIVKWIAGDDSKAGKIAEQAAGVARAITGESDDDKALRALRESPEAFLQFKAQMAEHALEMARLEAEAAREAERNTTERAKSLEGTATDLLQAGLLGRAVIFVRGAIRPAVTIGLGYVDVMVFSNRWQLPPDSATDSAFWIVNAVVFGFWFGERALQNAAPVLAQVMGKRG